MKIVKLNRRFKQFKDAGHTVALRFNGWNTDVPKVETICRERLGGRSYDNRNSWYGYFGSPARGNTYRPYWISFRNESDLTLVLLSVNLTQNG